VNFNHNWNSEGSKTILQFPSSTRKLTPINTGIRKIRQEYLTYIPCPIQTYASGSSHARKTAEEAGGVHKQHQQEEEEEDEEDVVRVDETVP
jgi:hypothetical protein